MGVDGFGLRGMQEWQGEAILPFLILDLDVGMRDVLVLAVPNLQPIDFRHFVQHLQLLDLVMRRLDDRLVAAFAGLILEPREDLVHDAQRTPLRPRFIAFGLIIVQLDETLVPLIPLRDVIVVIALVLLGGGVLAALPIVAIDHEYIFYVQVVREKFALYLLLLVFQQGLHHWHLALGVDHVNRPFLAAFLLFYGRGPSGHQRLAVHYLQGIAALELLQHRRQRIPALEPGSHIPFDPVEPNDIKTITLRVHLIYYQQRQRAQWGHGLPLCITVYFRLYFILQLSMEEVNQKAIDNAMFKKLQDLTIKMPSDPILYKGDVQHYLGLFKVEFEKVQGDTMKKNERFGELLIFLARSVKFFPEVLGWIPSAAMRLMEELGPSLHSYLRKKCAGSVMILRAKNILLPVPTITFLLKQMRLEDKQLRSMIYKYLLNDIRRMNSHHQNNKINQQIRAFVSAYIPKHTDKTAQKSLKLLIELYKRNVWTDNRTVNIIAEACFAPSSRSRMMACHFLMETTMPLEELPDSEDEAVDPADLRPKKGIMRQTKYKEKQLQKEKKKAARRLRKREIDSRTKHFMPIDIIYNPQAFAEKLFNIMSGKNEKYAHKLIYMSLIARVIWRHNLILLPFYRSLIKYLEPKQKDVHLVLAALAESIHEVVPQDEIETLVKHIIEHFVNDRCSEFTMTIGLNTLREIFKKLPSIITEEMMLYLCTYYEYRNKNVSRAAKSVINFVREYNRDLLSKKFRGKYRVGAEEEEDAAKQASSRIAGVEYLEHEGDVPIEIDRILTDEDFKKMKKIMKKKEEEKNFGKIVDNQINDEEDEQDQEGEEQEEGQEDGEEEEEDSDDEELEIEDDLAEEDYEEISGQDDEGVEIQGEEQDGVEIEGEDGEGEAMDEQSEESEESVIEWGSNQEQIEIYDAEEDQEDEQAQGSAQVRKTKKIKKEKKQKKPAKKVVQQSSSQQMDEQSQEEEDNPHGFIQTNQIAYYKYSKTELKADKKRVKEDKDKFKHKPKEKTGGGTTNKQKQKLKPLMMVRFKKNKIRSNEKQLKTKIKHLKNQLGKVRSGKQAKKLRNKKVVKKK